MSYQKQKTVVFVSLKLACGCPALVYTISQVFVIKRNANQLEVALKALISTCSFAIGLFQFNFFFTVDGDLDKQVKDIKTCLEESEKVQHSRGGTQRYSDLL